MSAFWTTGGDRIVDSRRKADENADNAYIKPLASSFVNVEILRLTHCQIFTYSVQQQGGQTGRWGGKYPSWACLSSLWRRESRRLFPPSVSGGLRMVTGTILNNKGKEEDSVIAWGGKGKLACANHLTNLGRISSDLLGLCYLAGINVRQTK